MTEKRVIKKYPNRRLYDTTESKYITLEDVRRLVIDGIPFCVTDKQTGEDITRNILLQIIIEREEAGAPLFTTDVLEQLIGFYGKSVQGAASNFIQQSLNLFSEQQQKFQEQMARAVTGDPVTAFARLTEQNLELWRRMQSEFLKVTGVPVSGQPGAEEKKEEPSE